ncbi:hypothetical protein Q3G72_014640 [Acer saccharum]|nr:hypothetical protein Q3G72_014640 [Acer saccharum]
MPLRTCHQRWRWMLSDASSLFGILNIISQNISIRPDARPLRKARDTTIALGAVASADGSALAKIGSTTMLAAIKMEVMTPSLESPDEMEHYFSVT